MMAARPNREDSVTIEHLSASATPKQVAGVLARDACVVIDRVATPETMKRLREELDSYIESVGSGPDEFSGRNTRRIGGLIARSETARELVESPVVLGSVREVLSHARNFQLHLTQVIAIGPGVRATKCSATRCGR
jgi:hypothetical protein